MRLCIVGYGSIAQVHAQCFRQLGGVVFDTVVGRDAQATEAFAAEHGFRRATTRLDDALTHGDFDAVVIASPSVLHAEQAEAALCADKDVLVEIPLAMNLADAERVVSLAEDRNRILMVAHTQRFYPALREAQRRIADGAFHLEHFVGRWFFLRRENVNWMGRRRSWTDNLLWHHACHVVDVALWLLNAKRVEVAGFTARPFASLGIPLDLNVALRTPDGRLATIAMSYNAHWSHHDYTLIGEEDTWVYSDGQLRSRKGTLFESGESANMAQNAEFLDAVVQRRTPFVDGQTVLPTMRVLQAIQDANSSFIPSGGHSGTKEMG